MFADLNSIVTNALFSLYGTGFMDNFYNMLRSIMDATESVIESSNLIQSSFIALSGITAALVMIFFFFELIGRITNETYTIQQVMVLFAKMIAAIFFCIAMPQICSLVIRLGIWLLDMVNELGINIINSSNIVDFIPNDKYAFAEAMDMIYPGGGQDSTLVQEVITVLEHPRWAIESTIIVIMTAVLNIVGYAFGIYTAIMLIVRLYFAPIGVVNLFRGMQSSGMRYFKSLLATAFTFPAMLAVVAAASVLGKGLIQSNAFTAMGLIDTEDYGEILGDTSSIPILTIDLSSAERIQQLDELLVEIDENPNQYGENVEDYNKRYPQLFANYISEHYPNVAEVVETEWHSGGKDEAEEEWKSNENGVLINGVLYDDYDEYMAVAHYYYYYTYISKHKNLYTTTDSGTISWKDVFSEAKSAIPNEDTVLDQNIQDPGYEYREERRGLISEIELEMLFALNFRTIIAAIIPQIAAIGGMAGASRLIHSVLEII